MSVDNGVYLEDILTPKDAALWLIENGFTNGKNPSSAICAVCAKKHIPCHGTKKSAYGFGWEFDDKKKIL